MNDTQSLARRISWWALLAMVFLVPVVMSDFLLPGLENRLSFSSVELVKVSVLRFLLLVALGSWAWDVFRRGTHLRRTPGDWLVLGLVVWVAVTTFTSVHWPTALFGTSGRYEGLLTFITYGLVYFMILQHVEDATHVLRLAQSLFVASLIVAMYGLLQYAGVVHVPQELEWQQTNRAFSTYGNPNMLGGFLIFSVAVALGLALREQRLLWRLVYWAGFGLSGLALIVSFTRGAWIGGAISLVLLGVMAWRQRVTMRRIDWLPGGLCGLAGIGLVVRSLFSSSEVTNFVERLTSIFQFGTGSGQTRTEIWQAAAASIGERPLLGWGADTFGLVFSKFKPVEYVRDAGGSSGANNAHDYPLHLASGIGIIGAVLLFGIFVWAGVRSFRTVFGRPTGPDDSGPSGIGRTRIVLGAFWAASVGYLFHLLFSLSVPGISFLLWVSLALVLAPTARSVGVKVRRWSTVVAAVIIVLAGVGIAGQAVVLAADRAYVEARDEFSLTPADRAAAANRALKLNPYVSDYHSALAAARLHEANAAAAALVQALEAGDDPDTYRMTLEETFTEAESAYEDAIDFTPYDYANYVNLAALYNTVASAKDVSLYQRAVETAERGLEVMPFGTAIRVELAEALVGLGKEAEAVQTLEYVLQIDPRDGSAALALAGFYYQYGRLAEALDLLRSVEALLPGQAGVAGAIEFLEAEMTPP